MAAPSYVFTIARVARMLGEDQAWLEEIALEMEPEDGRLYIRDIDDDVAVTAFTPGRRRQPQGACRDSQDKPAASLTRVAPPRWSPDAYHTIVSGRESRRQ